MTGELWHRKWGGIFHGEMHQGEKRPSASPARTRPPPGRFPEGQNPEGRFPPRFPSGPLPPPPGYGLRALLHCRARRASSPFGAGASLPAAFSRLWVKSPGGGWERGQGKRVGVPPPAPLREGGLTYRRRRGASLSGALRSASSLGSLKKQEGSR